MKVEHHFPFNVTNHPILHKGASDPRIISSMFHVKHFSPKINVFDPSPRLR